MFTLYKANIAAGLRTGLSPILTIACWDSFVTRRDTFLQDLELEALLVHQVLRAGQVALDSVEPQEGQAVVVGQTRIWQRISRLEQSARQLSSKDRGRNLGKLSLFTQSLIK